MKKITIITTTIYPDLGGGELYMFNLVKELSLQYKVSVLCITNHKLLNNYQNINGVDFFYLKKTKLLGQIIPSQIGIIRKIKELNPDLIYTSSPGIGDIFLTIYNIFLRKKMVMTYHGTHNPTTLAKKIFTKIYFLWVFRFYSSIIVTTDKYYQKLKKLNIQHIHHIPCGVEKHKLNIKVDLQQKKQKSILFVAMLTENHKHKRLPTLLNAMKKLSDYHLDIVGDGNMKPYYEKISKDLGLTNVVFHGKKTGKHLKELYEQSSLFVLPSNSPAEGFGIVLLEALGNGCKIIIGEKCGGAFLINENSSFGSTYNGEIGELIKTIQIVDKKPSLDMHFVETFLSQYYWDAITKKIIKTFNQK